MIKFPPFHPHDLLGEIPDLKNKTLLDLGAGHDCTFCASYISHIFQREKKKNRTEKEACKKTVKYFKNVVAVDLKYRGKMSTRLPGSSVRADALNLPFSDENFNIVTVGFLLDYFLGDDWELNQVISESARILKPDGYLIGDVPLHPVRIENDRFKIPKLLINLPRYFGQRKKYLKLMEKNELVPLKEGIGVYDVGNEKILAFYFIEQKI